jgi:hypothetical protein
MDIRIANIVGDHGQDRAGQLGLLHAQPVGIALQQVQIDGRGHQQQQRG